MSQEYIDLLERLKKMHVEEARLYRRMERIKAEIIACEMQLRVLHLEGDTSEVQ